MVLPSLSLPELKRKDKKLSKTKRILSGLFLIFMIFIHSHARAQVSLFQAPVLVQLEVRRGGVEEFNVRIANKALKSKAHFVVYVADVVQDSSGNYRVVDKGASPWSCAEWIEIADSDFVLGPQEGKDILCKLSVPRNIRGGGRYAAIVSELTPERKEEKALASLIFHYRMVTVVEVSIPIRARVDARISKMEVLSAAEYDKRYGTRKSKYGEDALVFTVSLKNEGNIHVFGKGKLIIRDEKRRRLAESPLGSGRGIVLPEQTVNFIYIKKGPPPGNYSAEAIIDYGGRRRARGEVPFTISAKEVRAAEMERLVNFRTKPEKKEVELPGRKLTRNLFFTVQNLEKEEIYVEVFAELIEGLNPKWSAVPLVEIYPAKFKIGPTRGQRPREKRVRVELSIPSGLKGGRYGRIVFKASPKEGGPAALEESLLYVTVKDTVEINGKAGGEIIEVGEELFYKLHFQNTGNIHFELNGTMVIREKPLMEEVRTESFASKELFFPDQTKELQVSLSGLPAGEYVAQATFSYGGKVLKVTKEFTVG